MGSERDLLIESTKKKRAQYCEKLVELFRITDANSDGYISWEEFEKSLQDPTISNYFFALGIHPDSTKSLFSLIDRSGDGTVSFEEFLEICTIIKGPATSQDVYLLTLKIRDILWYMEEWFSCMHGRNDAAESADTQIAAQAQASVNLAA